MSSDTLVLTRHFKASPARVFAAFTEKPLMQAWYGPESHSCPRCEVDARVGGKYRIELHSAAGSVNVVSGEFREIQPPERLVYTWGWLRGAGRSPDTLVTITFRERDGGTDLRLEQTGFLTAEDRDAHGHGWNSTLNSLDALLAGNPKGRIVAPVLLGDYRSPYVRSARIGFEEKGIAYALETTRPQSPEMLAVNPFGKMPALRCGELTLYETSAILRYLDETFPGPALMPSDPAARAKVEQWISALNCYGYPAMSRDYVLQYVFPSGPDGKPNRATIEAALPRIRKVFAALDAALGPRDVLVGDAPSLADILMTPMVANAGAMPEGKEMLASFPNLRRANEKFTARESFIRASQPPQTAA
jgi:glutathione S-transferase